MLKLHYILGFIAILANIQIHAASKYFATAKAFFGNYEIPADCAVKYTKSTTKKISLIAHDGSLMGHIEIIYSTENGRIEQGYIPELEVHPSFQRDGIGSTLFAIAAHKLVNVIGVSGVSWDACPFRSNISLAKLIEFYKKNGGKVVSLSDKSAEMALGMEAFAVLQKKSKLSPQIPAGSSLTEVDETTYEFCLCNTTATTEDKSLHYSFIAKKYPDDSEEWYQEDGSVYSKLGREQQPFFDKCMLEWITTSNV